MTFFIRGVFFPFFILFCSTAAFSQGAQSRLALKLSCHKDTFLVAEPIIVNVSLTNTGQEPAVNYPYLLEPVGHTEYFIITQGDTTRFSSGYQQDISNGERSLGPGKSTELQLYMFTRQVPRKKRLFESKKHYRENRMVTRLWFDHPGTYRLAARSRYQGKVLVSNQVELYLMEPPGIEDKKARNLFLKHLSAFSVFYSCRSPIYPEPVVRGSEFFHDCFAITKSLGDNPYRTYVEYYQLFSEVGNYFKVDKIKDQRVFLYKVDDLIKTVKKQPGFPLNKKAYFFLARVFLYELDDVENAKKWYRQYAGNLDRFDFFFNRNKK